MQVEIVLLFHFFRSTHICSTAALSGAVFFVLEQMLTRILGGNFWTVVNASWNSGSFPGYHQNESHGKYKNDIDPDIEGLTSP